MCSQFLSDLNAKISTVHQIIVVYIVHQTSGKFISMKSAAAAALFIEMNFPLVWWTRTTSLSRLILRAHGSHYAWTTPDQEDIVVLSVDGAQARYLVLFVNLGSKAQWCIASAIIDGNNVFISVSLCDK